MEPLKTSSEAVPQLPLELFARLAGNTALTVEQLAVPDRWEPGITIPAELSPRAPEHNRATPQEHITIGRIVAGLVEVLDAQRRLQQVQDHLTPQLYLVLQNHLAHRNVTTPQGYRLRTLRTFKPRPHVIEAWGSAANAQQVRAVAARLEHFRYGWLCTAAVILQRPSGDR
ncbi:Rv3235 family protein [Amycolatopsis acidiphila]|uniref:Uncharacterized protein n=1 Tax=Amycolatopsis acidiphila TaxID=715473 RepID=A0A558A0K0_9PSEU|nr:Rv3235 family protein [Amycolatopsis acidiphila]TVT17786.1 hypothetical protein FNH06_30040 [Amycolatopsis acidiphila]UIJ59128.1 Rv3235 family protein [Amycolatopsis acidiphila]GHG98003.1 hypothetical protein GCM10017788_77760 [Amycolatopsis acidiphila]